MPLNSPKAVVFFLGTAITDKLKRCEEIWSEEEERSLTHICNVDLIPNWNKAFTTTFLCWCICICMSFFLLLLYSSTENIWYGIYWSNIWILVKFNKRAVLLYILYAWFVLDFKKYPFQKSLEVNVKWQKLWVLIHTRLDIRELNFKQNKHRKRGFIYSAVQGTACFSQSPKRSRMLRS